MSKVPNTTNAKEFAIHPAGGPFGFRIDRVKDHWSANCPKENPPDMYIIECAPIGGGEGRCKVGFFVQRNTNAWTLKRLCEAVGLSTEGGYESTEFEGKTFQCAIKHTTKGEKVYQNPVDSSIAPLDSNVNDDDDLPF